MKFNLLSGILLILLLFTAAFAYMQKVEADAMRLAAEQNEGKALMMEKIAEGNAIEAKRQAAIANSEHEKYLMALRDVNSGKSH